MAGITLEQAQAQLDAWLQASIDLAAGHIVVFDGKQITRTEIIEDRIKFWDARVKALSGTGGMCINVGVRSR